MLTSIKAVKFTWKKIFADRKLFGDTGAAMNLQESFHTKNREPHWSSVPKIGL
jgi:hypothetical protein